MITVEIKKSVCVSIGKKRIIDKKIKKWLRMSLEIVEKSKGIDFDKFNAFKKEIDEAMSKVEKNKIVVFPESDLDEIGKRTVVILELRKYYNLTYKYQGKIGVNSLKTKKEKLVSKKNEVGKQWIQKISYLKVNT